jgi:hypothetical protein
MVNKLVYEHLMASGDKYSAIAKDFHEAASLGAPSARALDRSKLMSLADLVQDFVVLKEEAERSRAVRAAHAGAKRAFAVRLGDALAALYEDSGTFRRKARLPYE